MTIGVSFLARVQQFSCLLSSLLWLKVKKKYLKDEEFALLTNVSKNKSQLWTYRSKGAYYECLKPTSQRNGLISLLTLTESKKKITYEELPYWLMPKNKSQHWT